MPLRPEKGHNTPLIQAKIEQVVVSSVCVHMRDLFNVEMFLALAETEHPLRANREGLRQTTVPIQQRGAQERLRAPFPKETTTSGSWESY